MGRGVRAGGLRGALPGGLARGWNAGADHFYFRLRRSDDAARHYFGWHVLCALAYQGEQRELVRVEAFTNATPASWRAFFAALPGSPRRIVCDAHTGMLKVIEERWPQTDVDLCEWHLRHALERLLDKIGDETAEALRPRTEAAFAGGAFWAAFEADARARGNDRLDAWLDHWSPIIAWQFARRGRADERRGDDPLTTGGLESFVKPIEAALYRRRYGLKNQERLNRLLLLFQLEANRCADERDYAKRSATGSPAPVDAHQRRDSNSDSIGAGAGAGELEAAVLVVCSCSAASRPAGRIARPDGCDGRRGCCRGQRVDQRLP